MYIIIDLITALVLGFSQDVVSFGLIFGSAMAPVAEVLLLLGLVGLYTRQSEAVGVPGLISLVCGGLPLGTVLSQDFVWANLLLGLGFVRGILSARQDLPAHRRRTSHRRRGDRRVGRHPRERGTW